MGLSPLREQAHQFGSLALSCGEFVAIHQGTAYAGHAASSPEGTGQTPTPGAMGTHPLPQLPLVTCPPSASLRQVVKRMSEECVHHLWVVDAGQTPLAIIAPGDILTLLVRRAKVISEAASTGAHE